MPDTSSLPAHRRCRVIVVGGGMAGLTLAASLGTAGVETVVIDRDSEATRTAAHLDGRTTAIALGSRRLLDAAGIWAEVAEQGAPILDIRIADGQAPVFLHYDHNEVGAEPFGHIIENGLLRAGMFRRLAALPSVTALASAAVSGIDLTADGASAVLEDGRRITGELLVGADGRGSFVRDAAGIDAVRWQYKQKAIACTMLHEEPHEGLAVEHFLPPGPFAVLPMTDDADGRHRSSIVWTDSADGAPAYAALSEDEFNAELQARVGDYLGAVRLAGKRFVYPLGVIHANRYIDRRMALVGDAAHAIHPIAGQGLNIGLRDVAALAEIVIDRARLGLDVGDAEALTTYQRRRRLDNVMMVAVTDVLDRLFSNDIRPVQLARDLGLAAVKRLPPLRRFFMRAAMGTAGVDLPRAIRGDVL